MIDAALGILIAVGLVVALIGTVKGMRSTPIVGGDEDGYLGIEGPGQLKDLVHRQRTAWRFLMVGFSLQFVGTMSLAVSAICRALW